MDLPSWSLGLSLIVLTIAIHTTGVVLLAFGLEINSGTVAIWPLARPRT
ncbi:MAG: hypothetical protein ACXWZR_09715 [Mycobacterium sp.]